MTNTIYPIGFNRYGAFASQITAQLSAEASEMIKKLTRFGITINIVVDDLDRNVTLCEELLEYYKDNRDQIFLAIKDIGNASELNAEILNDEDINNQINEEMRKIIDFRDECIENSRAGIFSLDILVYLDSSYLQHKDNPELLSTFQKLIRTVDEKLRSQTSIKIAFPKYAVSNLIHSLNPSVIGNTFEMIHAKLSLNLLASFATKLAPLHNPLKKDLDGVVSEFEDWVWNIVSGYGSTELSYSERFEI